VNRDDGGEAGRGIVCLMNCLVLIKLGMVEYRHGVALQKTGAHSTLSLRQFIW
jgi:hypothetical protein